MNPVTGAIVCDIEGTVGSISFVRDVLFPYAARHLPAFVRERGRTDPAVREQLRAVAEQAALPNDDTEGQIAQLLAWIDSDTKATPLKALQGMIWVAGYEAGDYRAHVYEDAQRRLGEWRARGIPLYVYSSGSVQAQHLFFQYSRYGDMRALFGGYFDTQTGAKHDPEAYRAIVASIDVAPAEVLFLSDIEAELDAAATAGLRTTWLIRAEDSPLDIGAVASTHPIAATFDDVTV